MLSAVSSLPRLSLQRLFEPLPRGEYPLRRNQNIRVDLPSCRTARQATPPPGVLRLPPPVWPRFVGQRDTGLVHDVPDTDQAIWLSHSALQQVPQTMYQADLGLAASQQFGFLLGRPGREWVMTEPQFFGAFGAVSFAYDAEGTKSAVKTVHTPPPGTSPKQAAKNKWLTVTQFLAECVHTVYLRSTIEAWVCDGGTDALLQGTPWAGPSAYRMRIENLIVDDTALRAYAVMTAQEGSLKQVDERFNSQDRVSAAVCLAVQGYAELSALHEHAQCAHLDVSLANFLHDMNGRIRLMDFGLTEGLDGSHGQSAKSGWRGTLLAPEMSAPGQPYLGAAADVFALAVAVFDLAAGGRAARHLYLSSAGRSRASRAAFGQQAARDLDAFKQALALEPGAAISADCIVHSEPGIWRSMLLPLAEAEPGLCELLFNRALVVDPGARANSTEMAAAIRALDAPRKAAHYAQFVTSVRQMMRRSSMLCDPRKDAMDFAKWYAQSFFHTTCYPPTAQAA